MASARSNSIEKTIASLAQPMAELCAHLKPRLPKIRSAWQKSLALYESCERSGRLLAAMKLGERMADACSMSPEAFRDSAEEQGRELARRGVPPECLIVAIPLFAESCLPCLPAENPKARKWLETLLKWSSLYQHLLLAGHAREGAAQLHSLEERVNAAVRNYQDSSVRLGDAYEKERKRLAHDLHDEIGHDLIVLKLYTEIISMDLKKGDLPQVRRKLKESVSLIKHVLSGVRNLVFDLGPAVWNEQGFVPAVKMHVRLFSARTGLKVRLESKGLKSPLPARYETALYKVLQGALANIAAHSGARNVKVALAVIRNSITLKIEDDGKGFDLARKMRTVANSYGLRAMKDRIEMLGGRIQFTSNPAGKSGQHGTRILCELPLGSEV